MSEIVFLDTGTTGLGKDDEVLVVSIVDINGNELFHKLIKPSRKKSWPEAQAIHGISPDDLKNAEPISVYRKTLDKWLSSDCVVAGYNLGFHTEMLLQSGYLVNAQETIDVMLMCEEKFGYWPKLYEAAQSFGYTYRVNHGPSDAKACAYVYKMLTAPNEVQTKKKKQELNPKKKSNIKHKITGCAALLTALLCLLVLLLFLNSTDVGMLIVLAISIVALVWRGIRELKL